MYTSHQTSVQGSASVQGFIDNSNECRACSVLELNQHTMQLYAPVVAGFVNVRASLVASFAF